ncbi:hypothetical protein ACBJ59_22895 [Nonomuraea sp. MTCD27]|uniref:hypothetical protein n=1 Tax=Nonomuraea sp. MTCD27 TaxID=1676747 RepID=UPI0035C11D58
MARGLLHSTRTKPQTSELLILRVLRFVPMGYDQWFRLSLPVSTEDLPFSMIENCRGRPLVSRP